MHLRMCVPHPQAMYLDLCEERVEHDRAKRLPRRLQLERATPQVIFNDKELQTITVMCFQWTVNKTGKYLATVQIICVVSSRNNSPKTIMIVRQ